MSNDSGYVCPANIIYAIHHPKSRRVYVGKSTSGLAEPKAYKSTSVHPSERSGRPVSEWVKTLQSFDFEYEIVVLEHVSDIALIDDAERFYISYFKSIGMDLLNVLEGGSRTFSGTIMPFSQRMRLSIAIEEYGVDPIIETIGLPVVTVAKAAIGIRVRCGNIEMIINGLTRFLKTKGL